MGRTCERIFALPKKRLLSLLLPLSCALGWIHGRGAWCVALWACMFRISFVPCWARIHICISLMNGLESLFCSVTRDTYVTLNFSIQNLCDVDTDDRRDVGGWCDKARKQYRCYSCHNLSVAPISVWRTGRVTNVL